jgi:enterochelin esterase-like enzyme
MHAVVTDHFSWYAPGLHREVQLDCYRPATGASGDVTLLLLNDGQDLPAIGLNNLLATSYAAGKLLYVVGIHAGQHRKQEYGTASYLNSLGQGATAALYSRFVVQQLLPFIQQQYPNMIFSQQAFAGFSLGGLSALDIVWNHPGVFNKVGVFSGALWWRSKEVGAGYNESTDRIMHRQIREGNFQPGLQFFFECGTEDETADRNNNGIIDSIDDTLDLIQELEKKGYVKGQDITYLEIPGGRHDTNTWGKAMEVLLQWL